MRKAISDLQANGLPPDVQLSVVRDSSAGIRSSVANVQATLVEGGLLTVLIVFLFLHSWRSTGITGLTLPIAVIGTFAVLPALGDASTERTQALSTIKLPPGYRLVFGGSTKDIAQTAGYAGSAVLMAVLFIDLILASLFGNFLQPLAIMASLPLSLIGVFLGLLAGGSTLNIFSAIDFNMLMGLVVKNAILLVDFITQERARGTQRNAAILEAAEVRADMASNSGSSGRTVGADVGLLYISSLKPLRRNAYDPKKSQSYPEQVANC